MEHSGNIQSNPNPQINTGIKRWEPDERLRSKAQPSHGQWTLICDHCQQRVTHSLTHKHKHKNTVFCFQKLWGVRTVPHQLRQAVVLQVQLAQTLQTSYVLHSGDVVSCQVQNSELTQMRHVLDPADLRSTDVSVVMKGEREQQHRAHLVCVCVCASMCVCVSVFHFQ